MNKAYLQAPYDAVDIIKPPKSDKSRAAEVTKPPTKPTKPDKPRAAAVTKPTKPDKPRVAEVTRPPTKQTKPDKPRVAEATRPPTKSAKLESDNKELSKKKELAEKDSIYRAWYKEAEKEPDDFKSIELWGQIIALFPDSSRPYQARGFLYNKIGRFDDAISHCDKANILDKRYDFAHHVRGLANLGKKKWTEAIADFTKALNINNKLIKSYMNRSKAYFEINMAIEGCKDLNQALELASMTKDGSQDSLVRELKELIERYCISKEISVKP